MRKKRKQWDWVTLTLACGFLAAAFVCLTVLPGVRFSGYLFAGLAGLCLFWLTIGHLARRSVFWKVCRSVFAGCVVAVGLLLCTVEFFIVRKGDADLPSRPVDAVIVLGAGVNGTVPSLTLQTRIETAAEYIRENSGVPVVLSGGQGPGEEITEAQAMYNGLIQLSISPEFLILEENSTSTVENIRYSAELLSLTQKGHDSRGSRVAIVTNDFHLFRAKLIVNKVYPMEVVGVPAVLPWWWLNANYHIREAFAVVKTVIFDLRYAI